VDLAAAAREATAAQGRGDFAAAARIWRAMVTEAPASGEAWRSLADALSAVGQFPDAETAYRRAVALRPQAIWAQWGLAGFLQRMGRWPEADPVYARALDLTPDDPQLRLAYGHLKLGLGDFTAGWPLYESRKGLAGQGADPPPLPREWQGEPIAGRRLTIWPEQGFGDQIQFARYAAVLQARGAQVTLVCPPELAALFAELPMRVASGDDALRQPSPDYWVLALSVPGRLGTVLADVSGEPYLRAPDAYRAKWAGRAAPGSVGIAWRGRGTHPNDAHRSLPSVEAFAPLREAGARLIDLTEPVGDFADLAALVEQLDLVVTVDTAVGHLAGALGKPCWLLLPWFRQDWRWLQGREDSPWYAGHRLFRQSVGGDWAEVVQRVAQAWQAR
jgi:hypothetical protein